MENYLLSEKNFTYKQDLCKLRTSAHNLHIETGRHRVPMTPSHLRFCSLCPTKAIENEKHFLLGCPYFIQERESLYNKLRFTDFHLLSTENKFNLTSYISHPYGLILYSVHSYTVTQLIYVSFFHFDFLLTFQATTSYYLALMRPPQYT